MTKLSRRRFITDVAVASAGLTIVPRHVLGRGFTAPSDLLNVAAVGVGGQGRSNLVNLASENVVALCDVDWDYANKGFAGLDADIQSQQERLTRTTPRVDAQGRPEAPLTPVDRERIPINIAHMKRLKDEHLPRAARYQDYRQMLDRQKDIDAVVIATPDHMHAAIALAAMELGKHVYVQKPLTWSVSEARQLARKATSTRVATQMGNQGHSWDDARTAVEYVWAGAIGEVREVHVWTNRPLGYWPQGIPRPETRAVPPGGFRWNGPGLDARLATAMTGNYPAGGLEWDLSSASRRPSVSPRLSPVQLARPVDWAARDRHGRSVDHHGADLGTPRRSKRWRRRSTARASRTRR
jgi:hypothetical protein